MTPRGVASRIRGRGALLRSLRGLVIRAHRYGVYRAATADERGWAARLCDDLTGALQTAAATPPAQDSLAAADRHAARTRKGRRQPGGSDEQEMRPCA
jgi:hypothetical protein